MQTVQAKPLKTRSNRIPFAAAISASEKYFELAEPTDQADDKIMFCAAQNQPGAADETDAELPLMPPGQPFTPLEETQKAVDPIDTNLKRTV